MQITDLTMVEGIGKLFKITLTDADGVALDAALYNVTGGAESGAARKVDMAVVSVAGNVVTVVLPGLTLGQPLGMCMRAPWAYQLRITERSSGVTHVVLGGSIEVTPWCGETEASGEELAAGTVEVAAMLSAEAVEVQVVLSEGPAGHDAYELRYTQSLPAQLESAWVYDLGELAADADLSGLVFAESSATVQTAELWLSCGSTAYSVTWPSGAMWVGDEPELAAGTAYRFALRQEPNGNRVINLAYEYTV